MWFQWFPKCKVEQPAKQKTCHLWGFFFVALKKGSDWETIFHFAAPPRALPHPVASLQKQLRERWRSRAHPHGIPPGRGVKIFPEAFPTKNHETNLSIRTKHEDFLEVNQKFKNINWNDFWNIQTAGNPTAVATLGGKDLWERVSLTASDVHVQDFWVLVNKKPGENQLTCIYII